jgi:colanic acid biosynthesis glycosyl transferase WcaI
MRIVFVNMFYPPHNAPTGHFLADMCRYLAEKGHDVAVITSKQNYLQGISCLPSREKKEGVEIIRIWGPGLGKMGRFSRMADYAAFFAVTTWRLLLRGSADIVVCMTSPPMIDLIGLLHRLVHQSKFAVWSMDCYPEMLIRTGFCRYSSLSVRFLKKVRSFVAQHTDLIFALDHDMELLLRQEGYKNVTCVHNWADEDGRSIELCSKKIETLKAKLAGRKKFLALYLGNMGLPHEFGTFLDIAGGLQDHDELQFAFVGGGTLWPQLKAQTRERQIQNLQIFDYIPKKMVPVALQAADILLVCLRPEIVGVASPSKTYGYLHAGRPILFVGKPDGHIGKTLRNSGCGEATAIDRPQPGIDFVKSLLADPAKIQSMGKVARSYYEENFGKQNSMDLFEETLEACVKNPR